MWSNMYFIYFCFLSLSLPRIYVKSTSLDCEKTFAFKPKEVDIFEINIFNPFI